ncbi:MAG: sensor domain-containing diguanylate cyclase [Gallionella sp.]
MTVRQKSLLGNRPDVPSPAYRAEQVRLLHAGIPVSLAVNLLIASITAAVQLSVVDTKLILVWFTLFLATIVLRALFAISYRDALADEASSKTMLNRFRIGTAATGIAWGLASFLLFTTNDIPHQSFLVCVIAGMTAGAVTSLSEDLVSSLAFIIPAILALIARLFAVGGEVSLAMGVMGAIYLVALILNTRRIYLGNRENILRRLAVDTCEKSASEAGNSKEEFPIQRRLSISILVAMLATAFILVFLYRQDQLAAYEINAAENNEMVLYQLSYALSSDITSYVRDSENGNSSALPNTQNLDLLFAKELKRIKSDDILKIKVFNLSGMTIYSSVRSEIGKLSDHRELLDRALHGEQAHDIVSRAVFLGASGQIHNARLYQTYMPLRYSGTQIGVIESYADASSIFEKLQSKIISISLLVCGVFSALYVALFFAVRKADQSIVSWEKSVEKSEKSLNLAQSIAHVGSWDLNLATNKLDWSMEMYRIYGVSPETFTPSFENLINLIHPDDQSSMREMVEAWVVGKQSPIIEYRNVWADGSIHLIEGQCDLKFDANGKPSHVSGTIQDITERKRVADEIRNLAFHDMLTGLPNRRLLEDRLDKAIAASKRKGQYGAVIFLDLDNFKPLNDAHGHKAGDLLLVEVAQRLVRCVREVDTVARFGGDEFVVVLSELGGQESECVAQANLVAEKILSVLAEPYWLTYNARGTSSIILHHDLGACLGVALFTNTSIAENVLKWADYAMYQAKNAGRNQIRFYEAKA